MTADPRQTDLEDLLHYQDDPAFIGPRLSPDHPAYRAYLNRRAMKRRADVVAAPRVSEQSASPSKEPTP